MVRRGGGIVRSRMGGPPVGHPRRPRGPGPHGCTASGPGRSAAAGADRVPVLANERRPPLPLELGLPRGRLYRGPDIRMGPARPCPAPLTKPSACTPATLPAKDAGAKRTLLRRFFCGLAKGHPPPASRLSSPNPISLTQTGSAHKRRTILSTRILSSIIRLTS